MGDVVDLSQYAKDKVVEEPIRVWSRASEIGGRELRYNGGPRNGLVGFVGDEVERMVVPGNLGQNGMSHGGQWPGLYRYERISISGGTRRSDRDYMQYVGPTVQPEDEAPAIITINPDELPGNVDWGPDAL